MKIAITANNDHPEAGVDNHFGRCSWFVFYDTGKKTMEFIPNPWKTNLEGAGEASADFLISHKVSKIISGEFGLKVKAMFDKHHIQLIKVPEHKYTIRDIIHFIHSHPITNDSKSI